MEADSWSRFSKRHQSRFEKFHPLFSTRDINASALFHKTARGILLNTAEDMYVGFEDYEGVDDDQSTEFICPFCAEYFDIVELCCHIDEEHPVEAKNGVCPVCAARVGMDMVNHITTRHRKIFKMQRRRFRRSSSGSHYTLSQSIKELCEGNLQSPFEGSQYAVLPSSAPDPLLSSFITNLPLADSPIDEESKSLDDMVNVASEKKVKESTETALSDKDQEERARRSEFVQGLVISTIFDDIQ